MDSMRTVHSKLHHQTYHTSFDITFRNKSNQIIIEQIFIVNLYKYIHKHMCIKCSKNSYIYFKIFFLILHVTKIIKNIHVSNRNLNLKTAGHNLVKFKVTKYA